MAGNIVYDWVDPAQLIGYARSFDDEVLRNEFALEQFLPNTATDTLEYKVNKNKRKDVDIAEYRAFDTQPRMTGRQGFEAIRGDLIPVSRQIMVGEEETLRLRDIQNGTQDTEQSALLAQIYDDVENMTRAVQARIEVARGQVLTTGKFTLTGENGLTMEADFGMLSTHKPTAAASWALAATDILSDLLAWTQLYVDDNGVEPGIIVMPRTVLGYMFNNTGLKNAGSFAGTTPARLNVEMIDAIFAANGLPPIMLYDTNVRKDGVVTRVIPNDKILFLPGPGEKVGETRYGTTAEAIKLASKGVIKASEAPGIVACVFEQESPVQTYTLATAIAVPLLPNPNLVICADVVP